MAARACINFRFRKGVRSLQQKPKLERLAGSAARTYTSRLVICFIVCRYRRKQNSLSLVVLLKLI